MPFYVRPFYIRPFTLGLFTLGLFGGAFLVLVLKKQHLKMQLKVVMQDRKKVFLKENLLEDV